MVGTPKTTPGAKVVPNSPTPAVSKPNPYFSGTPNTGVTGGGGTTTIGPTGERKDTPSKPSGGGGGSSTPKQEPVQAITVTGTKDTAGKPIPKSQQSTSVYVDNQYVGSLKQGIAITDPTTGEGGLYYEGKRISNISTPPVTQRQQQAPSPVSIQQNAEVNPVANIALEKSGDYFGGEPISITASQSIPLEEQYVAPNWKESSIPKGAIILEQQKALANTPIPERDITGTYTMGEQTIKGPDLLKAVGSVLTGDIFTKGLPEGTPQLSSANFNTMASQFYLQGELNPDKSYIYNIGGFGAGVISAVIGAGEHPIQTAATIAAFEVAPELAIAYFASQAFAQKEQIGQEITYNPYGFAGEQVGNIFVFESLNKVVPKERIANVKSKVTKYLAPEFNPTVKEIKAVQPYLYTGAEQMSISQMAGDLIRYGTTDVIRPTYPEIAEVDYFSMRSNIKGTQASFLATGGKVGQVEKGFTKYKGYANKDITAPIVTDVQANGDILKGSAITKTIDYERWLESKPYVKAELAKTGITPQSAAVKQDIDIVRPVSDYSFRVRYGAEKDFESYYSGGSSEVKKVSKPKSQTGELNKAKLNIDILRGSEFTGIPETKENIIVKKELLGETQTAIFDTLKNINKQNPEVGMTTLAKGSVLDVIRANQLYEQGKITKEYYDKFIASKPMVEIKEGKQVYRDVDLGSQNKAYSEQIFEQSQSALKSYGVEPVQESIKVKKGQLVIYPQEIGAPVIEAQVGELSPKASFELKRLVKNKEALVDIASAEPFKGSEHNLIYEGQKIAKAQTMKTRVSEGIEQVKKMRAEGGKGLSQIELAYQSGKLIKYSEPYIATEKISYLTRSLDVTKKLVDKGFDVYPIGTGGGIVELRTGEGTEVAHFLSREHDLFSGYKGVKSKGIKRISTISQTMEESTRLGTQKTPVYESRVEYLKEKLSNRARGKKLTPYEKQQQSISKIYFERGSGSGYEPMLDRGFIGQVQAKTGLLDFDSVVTVRGYEPKLEYYKTKMGESIETKGVPETKLNEVEAKATGEKYLKQRFTSKANIEGLKTEVGSKISALKEGEATQSKVFNIVKQSVDKSEALKADRLEVMKQLKEYEAQKRNYKPDNKTKVINYLGYREEPQIKKTYTTPEYKEYTASSKYEIYPKKEYYPEAKKVYIASEYNGKPISQYKPTEYIPEKPTPQIPEIYTPIIPPPSTPNIYTPRTPITPPSTTPPKYPTKKKPIDIPFIHSNKPKKGSFAVEVRRKGMFKTEGVFETQKQAEQAGELKTLNAAAASFRIRGFNNSIVRSEVPSRKFYASRKEAGVMIQKREYRIGTAGEKREITYRGIFASKQKKARKSIWS